MLQGNMEWVTGSQSFIVVVIPYERLFQQLFLSMFFEINRKKSVIQQQWKHPTKMISAGKYRSNSCIHLKSVMGKNLRLILSLKCSTCV